MTPTEILAGALAIARKAARIELRVADGSLQWRTDGEWRGLLAIDDLRGEDGRDGKDGRDGSDGRDGKDGINGKDGADGMQGPRGERGQDGKDGRDGSDGQDGAEGPQGPQGDAGRDGIDGTNGLDGRDGIDGQDGTDGVGVQFAAIRDDKHLWVTLTNGAEIDAGRAVGKNGSRGAKGASGASAYEVAVKNGFTGTEVEWLASLGGSASLQWIDYASHWDTDPALVAAGTYAYTWQGVTRYRFVPDPYVAAQDAFYTDLALTDLIIARGN